MRLDLQRIASRTSSVSVRGWPRIFSAMHRATPTNTGFGSSRFSSPSAAFRVLYAAQDFPTAFAEAVVRDRFEERLRRYLYRRTLEDLVVAELDSRAPLALVDLTRGGAYELGVDTDALGAREHAQGQEFAESLHRETSLDGVLYPSRMTGQLCVAIFDRAFSKLAAGPPVDLVSLAALADEIYRLGIVVRRRRYVQ